MRSSLKCVNKKFINFNKKIILFINEHKIIIIIKTIIILLFCQLKIKVFENTKNIIQSVRTYKNMYLLCIKT